VAGATDIIACHLTQTTDFFGDQGWEATPFMEARIKVIASFMEE
jgi:hypothetical protein